MADALERHARRQARDQALRLLRCRTGRRRGRKSSSSSIARLTEQVSALSAPGQHLHRPAPRHRMARGIRQGHGVLLHHHSSRHAGASAAPSPTRWSASRSTSASTSSPTWSTAQAAELEGRHEGQAILASARRRHAPADVPAGQGRDMTGAEAARGRKAVARFLRPRSVAIVGISARAGQRRPGHSAIAQAEQLPGRHPPGRPQRRADRRPSGAEEPGRAAGGRRPGRVHAAGRRRARRRRGVRETQGGLGDGVRRGLCRGRRAGDAGRDRGDGAQRRPCHRRAELPRLHQQRRRHDAAHAVRPRSAALRRRIEARVSPSSARAAACSAISSGRPTGAARRCLM